MKKATWCIEANLIYRSPTNEIQSLFTVVLPLDHDVDYHNSPIPPCCMQLQHCTMVLDNSCLVAVISDRYNSFKDTCNDIREGWRATKLVFKLFRQLELPKGSETQPQAAEAFVENLKNSEDLPESFKNLRKELF